jgi:hypothetical protein
MQTARLQHLYINNTPLHYEALRYLSLTAMTQQIIYTIPTCNTQHAIASHRPCTEITGGNLAASCVTATNSSWTLYSLVVPTLLRCYVIDALRSNDYITTLAQHCNFHSRLKYLEEVQIRVTANQSFHECKLMYANCFVRRWYHKVTPQDVASPTCSS